MSSLSAEIENKPVTENKSATIEQALLTASADSPSGYRLVRRSPGLCGADARELTAWDPEHGSLLNSSATCGGTHFFRLSSGAFCLSRIARQDSRRNGAGFTHMQRLVISAEALRSFGNDPFAVLRAAAESRVWLTSGELPDRLEGVRLAQHDEIPQSWLTWENTTMGGEDETAEIGSDAAHDTSLEQPQAVEELADALRAKRDNVLALLDEPASNESLERLTTTLAAQSPAVLELLERIDDLVFSAISGDPTALAELEVLWPLAAMDLDEELIEQSREQYLRCALSIWGECVQGGMTRTDRAVSAIDVLCVLFEE